MVNGETLSIFISALPQELNIIHLMSDPEGNS